MTCFFLFFFFFCCILATRWFSPFLVLRSLIESWRIVHDSRLRLHVRMDGFGWLWMRERGEKGTCLDELMEEWYGT